MMFSLNRIRCSSSTSSPCSLLPILLTAIFLLPITSAHMAMVEPPPINHKQNPYTVAADGDYTSPLSPSGSNYPCRGQLKYLSSSAGAPVRTYKQGGKYSIAFEGSAVHNGGSCQLSLSYDGGASWGVFKSFIGGCPQVGKTITFTIPSSAPNGNALLAWTWFNQIGNREMYMNCASVTIGNGKRKRGAVREMLGLPSAGNRTELRKRAFSGEAPLFIANVGNGCTTVEGTDVVFPSPGKDVEYSGDPSKQGQPKGTCNGKTYVGGGATGGTAGTASSGTGTGATSGGVTYDDGMYRGEGATYGSGTSGSGTATGEDPIAGTVGWSRGDGREPPTCEYWRSVGYLCAGANGVKPEWGMMAAGVVAGLVAAGWVV